VAARAWSSATRWLALVNPASAGTAGRPGVTAASAPGTASSVDASRAAKPRANGAKPAATTAGPVEVVCRDRLNRLRELAQPKAVLLLVVLTRHSNNSGHSRHRTLVKQARDRTDQRRLAALVVGRHY
jgi:hypothetical protein